MPLPLVWAVLLVIAIVRRDGLVFPLGFLAGIALDVLTVHPIGTSSSIFMVLLFLVFLYERKYEIYSLPFVVIATFVGGVILHFL